MELMLPAMFDNRHEKNRWVLMPFIGLLLIIIFGFVPILLILRADISMLTLIFSIAFILLIILGMWYLISIPAYIFLDSNFIFMRRFGMREYHPLRGMAQISRMSSGIMLIKMKNGKEIIRMGIDDRIILQLIEFYYCNFTPAVYEEIRLKDTPSKKSLTDTT
jgi:hypothetical protein